MSFGPALRRQSALIAAFLAAPGAYAIESPPSQPAQAPQYTEFGLSQARELLSNSPNAWNDTQLELLHKFAPRQLLIGRATDTERFGLRDHTLGLSSYYPLAARTTGYAEFTSSDTHRVLARDSLHLQLAQSLADGWGVLGGLRHMNYTSTAVDVADLTLERYFSDYRIALSAYPSRSQIAGNARSYRLQFSRYYGDENNVQLMIASGTEVDKPTGIGTVLATSVRAMALYGRHWLTRDVGLVYSVGHAVQGESTRRAASLGLRYRF